LAKFTRTWLENQEILIKKLRIALSLLSTFGVLEVGFAQDPATTAEAPVPYAGATEPLRTGWQMVLDNDALVPSSSDRDYTGGLAVSLGGRRAANYPFSLDPILSWINRLTRMDKKLEQISSNHMIQFGLMLFTPKLNAPDGPVAGDRPYANLLFLENTQFRVNQSTDRAYQTTFTAGVLGTKAAQAVQNSIHSLVRTGSTANYDNQVSDGGELTARYAVSRQSLLLSNVGRQGNTFETKARVEGDLGYLTEASATLAARWGRIESPWWDFAPSRSNYLPQPPPTSGESLRGPEGHEFYVWSAITLRARAYNAFLQGQFRDSEVTLSGSDLNHILGEVSVGLSRRFGDAVDADLTLACQTSEIKHGIGAEKICWGGLTIRRSY
jgi:hypothetical protein